MKNTIKNLYMDYKIYILDIENSKDLYKSILLYSYNNFKNTDTAEINIRKMFTLMDKPIIKSKYWENTNNLKNKYELLLKEYGEDPSNFKNISEMGD